MSQRRRRVLASGLAILVMAVAAAIVIDRRVNAQMLSRARDRLELSRAAVGALAEVDHQGLEDAAARAAVALGPTLLAGVMPPGDVDAERSALDLDMLAVIGPSGTVLGGSVRDPRFGSGVRAPTIDDLAHAVGHLGAIVAASTVFAPDRSVAARVLAARYADARLISSLPPLRDISIGVYDDDRLLAGNAPAHDARVVNVPLPGAGARFVLSMSPADVTRGRLQIRLALEGGIAGVLLLFLLATWWVARVDDSLEATLRALHASRGNFRRAVDRLGDALAAGLDRRAIVDVILETSVLTVAGDAAEQTPTA
jgi:hypothetical protein